MNTSEAIDFFEKIDELLDIPNRLSLIHTCMIPVAGLTDKERDIVINAVDSSIILSFCKVVGKNSGVFKKALPYLEKENPELYNKVSYFKTVRDKVIAHIDLDNIFDRISLDMKAAALGNTFDEVLKSYNDILEWILEILDIRGYYKTLNERGEPKIPDDIIERASVHKLLDICRAAKEQEEKIWPEIVRNAMEQALKGAASHE